MNYKAIYYKIIENAKKETENGNRFVGYYENHHILPKSLGGNNDKNNLVKLTAREHFICHWLLVKMYDKGTIERKKMLCALWRMQGNFTGNRYINNRVYEKLRVEFAEVVSKMNMLNQKGEKNSQFGTKWYTNRNTGESKKFKEQPVESFWIEGRNLFHGETSSLLKLLNANKQRKKAEEIWNEYHAGNYTSIRDYCRKHNELQPTITNLFKTYIPIYYSVFKSCSQNNNSKPEYINVFK